MRTGCSKMPSSKAAANEEARRTLRSIELLSEARTPLADSFSILLARIFTRVCDETAETPSETGARSREGGRHT